MERVQSSVKVENYGDGLRIYTLQRGEITARIMNWGATVLSLTLPDAEGKVDDVVLGFDTLTPYQVYIVHVNGEEHSLIPIPCQIATGWSCRLAWQALYFCHLDGTSPYFGCIVGRVANRIGGAQFSLGGKSFNTVANDGVNTLHGGAIGYDKVLWNSRLLEDCREPSVQFTYHSFDGEQGFPGDLDIAVTYTLSADNELRLDMTAKPRNKETPVSLAHHTYWNLAGHGSGDILKHKISILGSHITQCNEHSIPTGKLISVTGTAFDFLEETCIGRRMHEVPGGYDHNYALETDKAAVEDCVREVARLSDPSSGRIMCLSTNAPGMQFYTGNYIQKTLGKGGYIYAKHGGICLETQGFPDAVNHPNFPSIIVRPGEIYKHIMVHRFTTSTIKAEI